MVPLRRFFEENLEAFPDIDGKLLYMEHFLNDDFKERSKVEKRQIGDDEREKKSGKNLEKAHLVS